MNLNDPGTRFVVHILLVANEDCHASADGFHQVRTNTSAQAIRQAHIRIIPTIRTETGVSKGDHSKREGQECRGSGVRGEEAGKGGAEGGDGAV